MKLCECGCCGEAPIANRNSKTKGWIKGKSKRYIHNHHRRLSGVEYIVDEKTNCWIWQRSKDAHGYGFIGIGNRKTIRAHRHYYEKYKGKISQGLQLDHLCRNKSCVNPDHLEPVTNAENQRRGARAKLSYVKVKKIKKLYKNGKTMRELGMMFDISHTNISKAIRGKSWARK